MKTVVLKHAALASVLVLALAGCGETRGERALSGGAIGAGAGAVGGAVTHNRECDDVNDRPTGRCR